MDARLERDRVLHAGREGRRTRHALGDASARRHAPASWRGPPTGADVSHDGRRIATFQKAAGGLALTILDRDGAQVKPISVVAALEYVTPRWSPDDSAIAFIANEGNFQHVLCITDVGGGATHEIVRGTTFKGLAWLPDGSGLVYASAAGSALRYPPTFNLRTVSRKGRNDQQLTIGDVFVHRPGNRTARKDLREPHPDAVGHLALPDRWLSR